jgi:hypothetical protein
MFGGGRRDEQTCVELVDISYLIETALFDVVEGCEIKISRDAVESTDSELVKAAKKILCEMNRG